MKDIFFKVGIVLKSNWNDVLKRVYIIILWNFIFWFFSGVVNC